MICGSNLSAGIVSKQFLILLNAVYNASFQNFDSLAFCTLADILNLISRALENFDYGLRENAEGSERVAVTAAKRLFIPRAKNFVFGSLEASVNIYEHFPFS